MPVSVPVLVLSEAVLVIVIETPTVDPDLDYEYDYEHEHEHDCGHGTGGRAVGYFVLPGSLWPPNCMRIAERTFSAKVCVWRERKRV